MSDNPETNKEEKSQTLEDFMQAQVAIYTEAADKIMKNALEWHRKRCPNEPGFVCEKFYMQAFTLNLEQMIDMKNEELRMQDEANRYKN